ncbi:MAG: ABC transporter permease [Acidobacteria bacterium]|nr:ABC transporter permease [Acidobacteriota bacterium]
MAGSILRRLASSVLLFFLVLTLTFALVHIAPGNPLRIYQGPHTTRAQMAAMEHAYGLDRPLPVQYLAWLKSVALEGNWGISFSHQRPALAVIRDTIPNTVLLGLTTLLIQYGLGLLLGVAAARRPDGLVDSTIRIASMLLYSIPTFWLGLMSILLFHLQWHLLPASGMSSPGTSNAPLMTRAGDVALHLILPASVLGISAGARLARFVRNSLLDALSQDYVRTARAKGLSEGRVVWLHGLRNSLVPLAQLLGMSLPSLLNGTLVVEVVFAWPGLGRLLFDAATARDFPLILAGTAFGALLVIAGSLIADVLHRFADPRLRHG